MCLAKVLLSRLKMEVPPVFTVNINQQALLTERVETLNREGWKICYTHFGCLETWQRPLSHSKRSQWKPFTPTAITGIQSEPAEQNWWDWDGKLRSHKNSCNLQHFWLKFEPFHSHTSCTPVRQDIQTYRLSQYLLKPLECFGQGPGTGKISSWSFLRKNTTTT